MGRVTVSRDSSHQQAPRHDLQDFPSHGVAPGDVYYRCHQKELGEWFYATTAPVGTGGRWDLPSPDGTCYLAVDRPGALLEVLGPDLHDNGFVTSAFLEARTITEMRVPASSATADLTASDISRFGATAELTGAISYEMTQKWAKAWREVGFGGVTYGLRFDPNNVGLALFGSAGPAGHQRTGETLSASAAAQALEIPIVDTPTSLQMDFL